MPAPVSAVGSVFGWRSIIPDAVPPLTKVFPPFSSAESSVSSVATFWGCRLLVFQWTARRIVACWDINNVHARIQLVEQVEAATSSRCCKQRRINAGICSRGIQFDCHTVHRHVRAGRKDAIAVGVHENGVPKGYFFNAVPWNQFHRAAKLILASSAISGFPNIFSRSCCNVNLVDFTRDCSSICPNNCVPLIVGQTSLRCQGITFTRTDWIVLWQGMRNLQVRYRRQSLCLNKLYRLQKLRSHQCFARHPNLILSG